MINCQRFESMETENRIFHHAPKHKEAAENRERGPHDQGGKNQQHKREKKDQEIKEVRIGLVEAEEGNLNLLSQLEKPGHD